jgi:hypothetical protein
MPAEGPELLLAQPKQNNDSDAATTISNIRGCLQIICIILSSAISHLRFAATTSASFTRDKSQVAQQSGLPLPLLLSAE